MLLFSLPQFSSSFRVLAPPFPYPAGVDFVSSAGQARKSPTTTSTTNSRPRFLS